MARSGLSPAEQIAFTLWQSIRAMNESGDRYLASESSVQQTPYWHVKEAIRKIIAELYGDKITEKIMEELANTYPYDKSEFRDIIHDIATFPER